MPLTTSAKERRKGRARGDWREPAKERTKSSGLGAYFVSSQAFQAARARGEGGMGCNALAPRSWLSLVA